MSHTAIRPRHQPVLSGAPVMNCDHIPGGFAKSGQEQATGMLRTPVNAMLNYAYGILESHVRIKSVDPTLGIMHESREASSASVFDLMEPERPKVDRSILEFVKVHKFQAADFVIRSEGVCRLNPEMARHVALVVCGALE
jgi:CRISPR/Cas system-associated endonuclease Cas1